MRPPRVPPATSALPRAALFAVARIVLLYALFAGLWILWSDSLMAKLLPSPTGMQWASTLKGLLFVAVTAVLLFFLILRFASGRTEMLSSMAKVGAGETAPRPWRRRLVRGIALFSGIFVLLGAGGILQSSDRHRSEASAHLQSISKLKVSQIETWLDERRRDAQVMRGAYVFGEALPRWRQTDDPALRQRLLNRMEGFRLAMAYEDVWLTDSEGGILLQTGASGATGTEPAPELRQAVRHAVTSGEIVITDLYRVDDAMPDHVHLDVVAPLDATPGKAAAGAIVLRVDARPTLFAFLQAWPVPSASAESLLFRRDGDGVLFLNELRHARNTALTRHVPLSERKVLAVQALDPAYRPGDLLDGIDYRGTAVIGVAQPVAHTSWVLVTKADRAELYAAAYGDALWIVIASLLVLLATVSLAVLVFQRRELQYAQQEQSEQSERLRTLRLLDAIIGSSTDVIFAKDREGRYLLFNAEAARVMGKAPEQVIGRDDRSLFPAEQAGRIMHSDRDVIESGRTTTFQESLDTVDGEITYLATKGPLRDARGEVFGLFGISRDITKLKQAEDALHRQTKELLERNAELERFNRVVVGRELDMIVLKRLVNNLSRELGRAQPFDLEFADAATDKAAS